MGGPLKNDYSGTRNFSSRVKTLCLAVYMGSVIFLRSFWICERSEPQWSKFNFTESLSAFSSPPWFQSFCTSQTNKNRARSQWKLSFDNCWGLLIAKRDWMPCGQEANQCLSSLASQGTSNIPVFWFLFLGCCRPRKHLNLKLGFLPAWFREARN